MLIKECMETMRSMGNAAPLNERQIKVARIKHPALNASGVIDMLLESKASMHAASILENVQSFYEQSQGVASEGTILSIIREGVQDQLEGKFDPFAHVRKKGGEDASANDEEVEEIADDDCVVRFKEPNEKLEYYSIWTFSLPAGHTCPFARICKTMADRETGKLIRTKLGPEIKYKCSAAADERNPDPRKLRWSNYDLLRGKSAQETAKILERSLDYHFSKYGRFQMLRIHVAGDFFSQNYFDGWVQAARKFPRIAFYAYTKSLPYWAKRKDSIPPNFKLTASPGGTMDHLIEKEHFRQAIVVGSPDEAIEKELPIDINEFLALFGEGDFALLLHGGQHAGATWNGEPSHKLVDANREIVKKLMAGLGPKADPQEVTELIAKIVDRAGKL